MSIARFSGVLSVLRQPKMQPHWHCGWQEKRNTRPNWAWTNLDLFASSMILAWLQGSRLPGLRRSQEWRYSKSTRHLAKLGLYVVGKTLFRHFPSTTAFPAWQTATSADRCVRIHFKIVEIVSQLSMLRKIWMLTCRHSLARKTHGFCAWQFYKLWSGLHLCIARCLILVLWSLDSSDFTSTHWIHKKSMIPWPLCLPVHSARMHKPCADSRINGKNNLYHQHSTFIQHSPMFMFIYHLWLCSETAKLRWHVAQLPTATLEEIHRPAQGNYRSIWHLNQNTLTSSFWNKIWGMCKCLPLASFLKPKFIICHLVW